MKKIVAILLAAVLALSCVIPAFAVEEKTNTPLVLVRGMNFNQQYIDLGTPNERSYLSELNAGNILAAVAKAAASGFFAFDKNQFAITLTKELRKLFAPIACDKNGNSIMNVSVKKYPGSFDHYVDSVSLGDGGEEGLLKSAIAHYGAENVYYYTYDWRIDPFLAAKEIHETVELAKKERQAEKVNIICCSMGGVLTNTYFYEYGWDSVNSCIYYSSTINGALCATELLQGKAEINEQGLRFMLSNLSDNPFLFLLLKTITKTAFFSAVCRLGNQFIDDFKDIVYEGLLRDCFGTIPSLWALVFPEEVQACADYLFPTEELKAEYKGVLEHAERSKQVSEQKDEMLKRAAADGCKISVVASYGKACVPFYEGSATQGDGTLESAYMLGGAKVANVGESFKESYKPAVDGMLSPDRVVDLSSVLFPESTWAIKDAPHVASRMDSDYTNFLFALLDSPVQPTVDNMKGYQRFMAVDNNLNFIPFQ